MCLMGQNEDSDGVEARHIQLLQAEADVSGFYLVIAPIGLALSNHLFRVI